MIITALAKLETAEAYLRMREREAETQAERETASAALRTLRDVKALLGRELTGEKVEDEKWENL